MGVDDRQRGGGEEAVVEGNVCPACAKHGLVSTVKWKRYGRPCDWCAWGRCTRNHLLGLTDSPEQCECPVQRTKGVHVVGLSLGLSSVKMGPEKRYVHVFQDGKWRTYDLLALPRDDDEMTRALALEKEQQPVFRRQVTDAKVAWMLCSKRLGVCKDVARIMVEMMDRQPFPLLR